MAVFPLFKVAFSWFVGKNKKRAGQSIGVLYFSALGIDWLWMGMVKNSIYI